MADKQPSTFYRCLSVILTPVMLIHAISRSMKDGGWRYLKQRCAVYSTAEDETPSYRWIHAASVGEVNTVMPLIKELQQRVPKLNVLVTTTTPTGAEVLSKASGGSIKIKHCYLPIDTKAACTRFLRQYDVCSLWVVETEIWPWLYSCCHQQQIPVTIINARLSRRTTKHARRWSGKVLGHAIKNVDILARSSIDAERYMQLGAAPGRTRTIGNLKHARRAEPDQVTRLSNRTYVVAASTHHDEEIQLAKRWSELPDSQQPPRLLIVIPRHPERGPEIQQRLKTLNVPCELRSRQQEPQHEQRVYIADTVGELMCWYAYATAAFVGGSLVARGGQNMLEPALFGCPTIVGTHTANFEDIMASLLSNNAITLAQDADAVIHFFNRASENDPSLAQVAQRARKFAMENSTLLTRYLDALLG